MRTTDVTKEKILQWIYLYNHERLTTQEIANKEGISNTCVYYHLSKNIKLRSRGESRIIQFSPNETECIIKKYNLDKLPMHKIGKEYNVSEEVIRNLLIKNNIKIKDFHEAKLKYDKDFNFFKNPIDWEQKHAYFLGWLMSDGHHNPKHKYITIKLQERDKRILEILKEIIKFEGPLHYEARKTINNLISQYTKTYQNRWSLRIGHSEISKDLLNLDIDNNKTNNLTFPPYLREDLWPHYLRAFYEGDGTISYSMLKGQLRFEINVIATLKFCESVQQILKNKLNIDSRIIPAYKVKNGNMVLRVSGNENAIKIFNYLYENAEFCLKRKFQKFIHLLNYMKRTPFIYDTEFEQKNRDRLNHAILIALDTAKNAQY